MRIDNADGGEVEACGNATRCVGMLLLSETGRDHAVIETRGGRLVAFPGGADATIAIDMGLPRFGWQEIPLAEAQGGTVSYAPSASGGACFTVALPAG